jgi:hypothetical protein
VCRSRLSSSRSSANDIEALQTDSAGVVAPLDAGQLRMQRMGNLTMVGIAPLRSYLARLLAILDERIAAPAAQAATNRGFFSHPASD